MDDTEQKRAWMKRVLGVSIPDPSRDGGDPDAAFRKRLSTLTPRIQAASGQRAQDAKLKASEAGVFARKKDFARANALLDEAARLLSGGIPSAAPPLPSTTDEEIQSGIPTPPPLPGSGKAPPPPRSGKPADVRTVWRDAKEETDASLEALARELRSYDDPDLEQIAEFGLFGIGKGENVALNKALIEFSSARPESRNAAAKSLRDAVTAYRAVIDDDMVELIDNNPFGIQVSVRATLSRALDEIEQAVG